VEKWPEVWKKMYEKGDALQKRFLRSGLTYGEIVALSGDFYESPEHLNKAPLREIYDLLPLLQVDKSGRKLKRASTAQLQEATGGRYMSLAKRNTPHFSKVPGDKENNMATWRRLHVEAIMIARSGNANLAYLTNASADHFLTDRFAGGHIATSRTDLSTKGSLKALAHHDIDNKNGVTVENARGDSWIAFGDSKWNIPQNAENRKLTVEAVHASASDVRDALSQRESYPAPTPQTVFAAEKIIPKTEGATPQKKHSWWQRFKSTLGHLADLPQMIKELWTSDNMVRDWVAKTDGNGIKAQPVVEQIRMIDTLLSGYLSADDADAIVKICRNVNPAAVMEIRKKLEPLAKHGRKAVRERIAEALRSLP
jgi:hypothetical protein